MSASSQYWESDEESLPEHPIPRAILDNLCTVKMDGYMINKHRLCIICVDEFELNQEAIKLGCCLNAFHKDCLIEWFQRPNTCPVCRQRAPELNNTFVSQNRVEDPGPSGQDSRDEEGEVYSDGGYTEIQDPVHLEGEQDSYCEPDLDANRQEEETDIEVIGERPANWGALENTQGIEERPEEWDTPEHVDTQGIEERPEEWDTPEHVDTRGIEERPEGSPEQDTRGMEEQLEDLGAPMNTRGIEEPPTDSELASQDLGNLEDREAILVTPDDSGSWFCVKRLGGLKRRKLCVTVQDKGNGATLKIVYNKK